MKISEQIEPTDNHTAEFQALITWHGRSSKIDDWHRVCPFRFTSCRHGRRKEFVKNEMHKEYLTKILESANTFDFFFIKWIPDEENRAADALAREANS